MVAKTDKSKLASAILNVGQSRITGVEKGATVNGGPEKADKAPLKPQGGTDAPEGPVGGAGGAEALVTPSAAAPAAEGGAQVASAPEAKADRVTFLCTSSAKKHLKRLAIDRDTDVSSLIREALEAKGYLPNE